MTIEPASPSDAHEAANLAAAKRAEYEAYSPVFWRVADGARDAHEPFLAKCLADDEMFTSLAARSGDRLDGILLAMHKLFPPPLAADPEPTWLVDDFFVTGSGLWSTVGLALLEAAEQHARDGGAERLVVLSGRRDLPKRTLLEDAGYGRGASWWVRALTPTDEEPPALGTTEAIVGQAPPVFDPGGPTGFAASLTDPTEVHVFDRWAAASGAVVGIVPVRSERADVESALADAGYEAASDWFVKRLA